ncbi:polysaccharide deacetylase family protein (plasmid) [Acaryochloris sp. 'Moss Beach']|uniref:polysaccharide deacetylase family protein n=1 Tax=Acaryochloris sp. 'Moss Beach' TaxID=2740837 RepID=UPI001F3AA455|nr:polysaccharide deacetylase family protein [Acaryochloris sp. 'Moss Beach']UJB73127.1 polysaccharide deacetylase family protein [Acaryochloris sp. 'Moss Beach']
MISKLKYLRCLFLTSLIAISLLVVALFPSTLVIRSISPFVCPGAVYQVKTDKQMIALTIDDGPQTGLTDNKTQQILDVLSEHNAHATFFLISDKVQQREANLLKPDPLIQQMVNEKHELGNHMTRDEPSIKLGDRFESDLLNAKSVLDRYALQQWMRPGGGFCTARMSDLAQKHLYKIALGSIFPYDTLINSPKFSNWFITANLRPGGVIVLHDDGINGRRGERTYQALKILLENPRIKDYEIVTLSTLLAAGEPIPSQIPIVQPILNLIHESIVLDFSVRVAGLGIFWIVLLALMLAYGFKTKFIDWELSDKLIDFHQQLSYRPFIYEVSRIFFVPALLEEIFIRGVVLNHFLDKTSGTIQRLLLSFVIGVVIFCCLPSFPGAAQEK